MDTRLHVSKEAFRGITDEQSRHMMNKTAGASNAEGSVKLPENKQSKAVMRMSCVCNCPVHPFRTGVSLSADLPLDWYRLARVRKILVVFANT